MIPVALRSPKTVLGVFVAAVAASSLTSSSSGVQSGLGSFPANCSSALPSCGFCHGSSGPSASSPQVTISTASNRRAVSAGNVLSVTTALSGGVAGTTGGFICEATAGAFTGNGTTAQVISNSLSVTHSNNTARSWTYTWTAPTTVGLVQMTAAGNSTNGSSSSSGDLFGFSGYDRAATSATPIRLFVLPSGVTNVGSGCPDGYGNYPVLGANGTPSIGNASFTFQLYGLSPAALGCLWIGTNSSWPNGIPLTPAGITGCTSYVPTLIGSVTAVTSGSATTTQRQRAEGTASFAMPIPNNAALHGLVFDAQGGVLDPSVTATRTINLTLTNGLHIVIP